ncbi:hypothetical protein M422DRAFT_258708 [Sphaerobolus stellatus SS14]|uniref:Uncharacterized protein n=1 Tax=Sphaerobolus stellatus (strain SS14) TaxID=990650 RepID=A0A0C9UUQ3_SPHS4|nr:hypothetical protein M422DRAFT_258708 [Sphaerobolus stellatus SS14]
MNVLREEIKETISATIKEKSCSEADSITTVSHSITALDTNAQYWSDLSNKVMHHSCRALELQLKMAEGKVNTLLYEEAPEEMLLEAAQEAYRPEVDTPLPQQSTPALSMTAQLDYAVVNRTTEYSGIQQMVRQAVQNASHKAKPEKSFLAKASVKMGNLPLTAQDWEDQPEEDDQQYHFDDEEYEMRSIDKEVVHVNAAVKASGYNDHHRLYGIRVWKAETDMRVSAVVQTGGKEQPVYDYRARRKAQPLPTRGKENETISVFWDIARTKTHCLLDSGCEGIMILSEFVKANKLPKFELDKPVILQLACMGNHWSLHMWNILKGWHTNPMSIPNAIRDNNTGYFLKEDMDVAAWLSKIATDIPHSAFMHQMKAVPAPVKLPTGAEFLTLILKHCSLSKEQIYTQIIPYMERDDEKQPYSTAGVECAVYMQLHQSTPAPNKGKRPLTGSLQSKFMAHAPQLAKTGESSQLQLDTDLDPYNQSCEPILPYDEEPPQCLRYRYECQ